MSEPNTIEFQFPHATPVEQGKYAQQLSKQLRSIQAEKGSFDVSLEKNDPDALSGGEIVILGIHVAIVMYEATKAILHYVKHHKGDIVIIVGGREVVVNGKNPSSIDVLTNALSEWKKDLVQSDDQIDHDNP